MKSLPFLFALFFSFLVVHSFGQIKWPKSIPFPSGGSGGGSRGGGGGGRGGGGGGRRG